MSNAPSNVCRRTNYGGVMVNSALKWDDHVAAITSKTARGCGFEESETCESFRRRPYYQAVIRPVLEYACPAWYSSFTKEQTKALEDVQRCALQIINITTFRTKKPEVRSIIPPSTERRLDLCQTWGTTISATNHIGHAIYT